MDLYLMSPPPASWPLLPRSDPHASTSGEVDPTLARTEWTRLARAIEATGAKVAVLAPDDQLVGMPFAAEAGQALPRRDGEKRRFLLPNMKQDHRKAERARWAEFVTRLGFEPVSIAEGTWEGQADVARLADLTFLFWGVRTDKAGAEAARKHFEGETMLVELWEPAHHGNIALLPIDLTRHVVVCADVVDDDSLALLEARLGRDRVHFVSEDEMHHHAANVLPVGNKVFVPHVLQPRVRKILERQGLELVDLEMQELCDKAHGACRRFVCKVDDAGDVEVPAELSLDAFASG